ncbi:hypothetical protein [Saccharothrix sp. ST-888]|uniref:hypothetical protein n=1 Tax=Saccharothrix sp. ST-888 TaxID=1427391 RepID=UPI0018CE95FD|nr:hypothetical protein [Saccharothrix sp. ST-888]
MSLGYAEPDADATADATIVQPACLNIPAEFGRADGPLRAGRPCQILDVGTEPEHREGIRARLKRLAARGVLAETEPGVSVPVARTPSRRAA